MIQIITVSAVAVCNNCRTIIHRGKGDFDRDEHWWHDKNGLATCPGAPEADPDLSSLRWSRVIDPEREAGHEKGGAS